MQPNAHPRKGIDWKERPACLLRQPVTLITFRLHYSLVYTVTQQDCPDMNRTYILLRNKRKSSPLYLSELKNCCLVPTDRIWIEYISTDWEAPEDIPEIRAWMEQSTPALQDESQQQLLKKYGPDNRAETVVAGSAQNLPGNEQATIKTSDQELQSIRPSEDEGAASPLLQWLQNLPEHLQQLTWKNTARYLLLIGAGAIMMLIVVGRTTDNRVAGPPQGAPVASAAEPAPETDNFSSISPEENKPDSFIAEETFAPTAPVQVQPVAVQPAPVTEKITVAPRKEKKAAAPINIEPAVPKETIAAVAPEPAPATTASRETENPATLLSKLQVNTNNYNVAAFGGIRNLQLTLHNNSGAWLEKVTVELNYLTPENSIIKKDQVEFRAVAPGAQAVMNVPKTTRGVKVVCKITNAVPLPLNANASAP